MIFGTQFNRRPIPSHLLRLFKEELPGGWILQGIATNQQDRAWMLEQADNGRRKFRVMPKRDTYGTVYGVYVALRCEGEAKLVE